MGIEGKKLFFSDLLRIFCIGYTLITSNSITIVEIHADYRRFPYPQC